MNPRGHRDCWLTAAIVVLLVWEGIRRRWQRIAAVTAIAIRRPVMPAPLRHGCNALTAADKRRLTGRAGRALREENHEDGAK